SEASPIHSSSFSVLGSKSPASSPAARKAPPTANGYSSLASRKRFPSVPAWRLTACAPRAEYLCTDLPASAILSATDDAAPDTVSLTDDAASEILSPTAEAAPE